MKILHIDKTDTTQNIAMDFIYNKIDDILIMSDIQTSGRGRLNDRTWKSMPGNFHGSYIINIAEYGIRENSVSILNDIVLDVIFEYIKSIDKCCDSIKIKRPNDILINNKKVSGVLIEVFYPYVIVGIGINTKFSPLPPISTSLRDEFGIDISNYDIGHFIYNIMIKKITCI